jgi:hypothetical protein
MGRNPDGRVPLDHCCRIRLRCPARRPPGECRLGCRRSGLSSGTATDAHVESCARDGQPHTTTATHAGVDASHATTTGMRHAEVRSRETSTIAIAIVHPYSRLQTHTVHASLPSTLLDSRARLRPVQSERALHAASTSRSQIARSPGLDRIDQHDLPLDGLYWPDFNSTSANYTNTTDFGAGVTIHLIDTGCKVTHREFQPQGRAEIVYMTDPRGMIDESDNTDAIVDNGGEAQECAHRALSAHLNRFECATKLSRMGDGVVRNRQVNSFLSSLLT